MNDGRVAVRNPRTGENDYWISPPSPKDLSALANRLREAQPRWTSIGIQGRVGALRSWKQALLDGRDELTEALATDTGRVTESVLEVELVVSGIERWCQLAPGLLAEGEAQVARAVPSVRLTGDPVPYPLVGVVSPWNFPLLLSSIDTIPALLAGCAVVVKPSEVTPRFVEPLVRVIESVPELRDVLAYVAGDGETGAGLIEESDLVCFTGSVATGRKVAEAAARRFVPAFLELGGKDPAIVLDGSDLERASSAILWGSTANAGQSCLSIERVYAAGPISEEFVELLVKKAERVELAYPEMDSGQIGPIIAEKQVEIIRDHLRDAVRKGATIQCGGRIFELRGGNFLRPTVLTNVDHSMRVMTEETFGPIVPVMTFSSTEEAIELANDSVYGLSAAVFAKSEEDARSVGRRIEAGAVSINDAALTAMIQEGEKNSFGFSGLGRSRMGPDAIKRFTRRRSFLIQTSPRPDPWWFEAGQHVSESAGQQKPGRRTMIREEMPLLARHEGEWFGRYIYVDPDAKEVDRHASHVTCAFPESDEYPYHQTNRYDWEDGRSERFEFPAEYRDGRIWFDTERIRGFAWEVDENVVVLTWTFKAVPGSYLYELIQLSPDGRHRARTWQRFENDRLVQRCLITEEKQEE